jgi:hypothetical protein
MKLFGKGALSRSERKHAYPAIQSFGDRSPDTKVKQVSGL